MNVVECFLEMNISSLTSIEHLQNETEPMDVKEEGIFIFDNAEQPLNEFS